MFNIFAGKQLGTHFFPALNLVHTAAWILIQWNVEAFNQLRVISLDEVRVVLGIVFGGFRYIIAKTLHQLKTNHVVMLFFLFFLRQTFNLGVQILPVFGNFE
ncbi:hypothetical protein D3C74_387470 [compost metagenome]